MSVFFPCSHTSLLSCSRRVVFLSLFLSRSFIGRRVQALYYSQIIVMTLIYEFDVSPSVLTLFRPSLFVRWAWSLWRSAHHGRQTPWRIEKSWNTATPSETLDFISKSLHCVTHSPLAMFTNNNMFFFSPTL